MDVSIEWKIWKLVTTNNTKSLTNTHNILGYVLDVFINNKYIWVKTLVKLTCT